LRREADVASLRVPDAREATPYVLEAGLIQAAARVGAPCTVARVGSMWTLFFAAERVDDWTSAARADTTRFARFFQAMLARGVFLAPSQFEANFISAAHSPADVEATVRAAAEALEAARD
ncbi:MAG TPA: hypothetical protein VHH91_08240, partial [Vicinamibacterales bacterium]|nr:hypothetical protein [Vicinamibacterales bacterium]